jgi:hypothetical protein
MTGGDATNAAIDELTHQQELVHALVDEFLDRTIAQRIVVPFSVRKDTFGRRRGWLLDSTTNGKYTCLCVIDADQRELATWRVTSAHYQKRRRTAVVNQYVAVGVLPDGWTLERLTRRFAEILVTGTRAAESA